MTDITNNIEDYRNRLQSRNLDIINTLGAV